MNRSLIAVCLFCTCCGDEPNIESDAESIAKEDAATDTATRDSNSELVFFDDRSKIEADLRLELDGRQLTVCATVSNKSSESIAFIDHPDFWYIAVYASDRTKDEAVNSGVFMTYHRATQEDIRVVKPNEATEFQRTYIVRKKPDEVVELEKHPQFFEPRSYMRIWDSKVQLSFHYGVYPKRLPENARNLGANYVMIDVGVKKVVPVSKILPAAIAESRPSGD